MSHTPDLTGSVVLHRDSVAVVEINTYPVRSPIGALRLGHLTLQADNPIALDRLSEAAGEAADKLRAAMSCVHTRTDAERELHYTMREIQEYLREEDVAVVMRDLDPHGDTADIADRADDLVRLAGNLRAACDAVLGERTPSDTGRLGVTVERVRGEP